MSSEEDSVADGFDSEFSEGPPSVLLGFNELPEFPFEGVSLFESFGFLLKSFVELDLLVELFESSALLGCVVEKETGFVEVLLGQPDVAQLQLSENSAVDSVAELGQLPVHVVLKDGPDLSDHVLFSLLKLSLHEFIALGSALSDALGDCSNCVVEVQLRTERVAVGLERSLG